MTKGEAKKELDRLVWSNDDVCIVQCSFNDTLDQIFNDHEAELKAKDEAFNLIAETVYMKSIIEKNEYIAKLKELVNSFNKSMVGGDFDFEAWEMLKDNQ